MTNAQIVTIRMALQERIEHCEINKERDGSAGVYWAGELVEAMGAYEMMNHIVGED